MNAFYPRNARAIALFRPRGDILSVGLSRGIHATPPIAEVSSKIAHLQNKCVGRPSSDWYKSSVLLRNEPSRLVRLGKSSGTQGLTRDLSEVPRPPGLRSSTDVAGIADLGALTGSVPHGIPGVGPQSPCPGAFGSMIRSQTQALIRASSASLQRKIYSRGCSKSLRGLEVGRVLEHVRVAAVGKHGELGRVGAGHPDHPG